MKANVNILSDYIKGNWILQEDVYILQEKKNGAKKRVNFLKNVSKNYLVKSFNKQRIIKKYNTKVFYTIHNIKRNLLYIVITNQNSKLSHEEYIYLISNNIMISFSIIKRIGDYKYLGLKLCSYIRLFQ
uniref:Uncharacterized protein n=1 Tax=Polysiphonia sp. TaxID=1967842 RepID=A0A1Z1MTN5_9FLOR|nr:hypothetical protein [Polysiphonia sp.]